MQTTIAPPKITVIQPQGHFNASNAIEFQRQMIKLVAQEGHSSVLVDLEQVESIDSAGLIALVRGLKLAQALSRRFSICCVSPSIRIIFELTQLDQVFEIFDSKATFEAMLA